MILCDCVAALEAARRSHGLDGATILTSSAHLAMTPECSAEAIDARVGAADIDALLDAVGLLGDDLAAALRQAGEADLAGPAARVTAMAQTWLYWAMCLDERVTGGAVTVIRATTGNAQRDAYYAVPWPELLRDHPDLTVLALDAPVTPPPRQVVPPLRTRLAYSSWRNIAYRLAGKVFARIGGKRPVILVPRDNELVKEVAVTALLRGAAIRPLALPPPGDATLSGERETVVRAAAGAAFDARMAALLPELVRAAARDLYCAELVGRLSRHAGLRHSWSRLLQADAAVREGRAVVLSNHLGAVDAFALHQCCRDAGIACVVAQHGVTVEICAYSQRFPSLFESAVADHVLVFDPENAAVQTGTPFAVGRALAVGVALDNKRAGRAGAGSDAAVWYVSTFLTKGATGPLNGGGRDVARARFELDLAEKVFARLPYPILYKTYPGNRTLDPDPVAERLRGRSNIRLYEDHLDLRYLVAESRLLITSRASSTIGWCLMSGRPVIFVDIPDQAPLRPEARAAMQTGLFLFDGAAPNFHESLHAFLAQGVEVIEALWHERAQARQAMIAQFFDGTTVPTGFTAGARVAATVLKSFLTERKP